MNKLFFTLLLLPALSFGMDSETDLQMGIRDALRDFQQPTSQHRNYLGFEGFVNWFVTRPTVPNPCGQSARRERSYMDYIVGYSAAYYAASNRQNNESTDA
jgi:hypothetical protein